MREKILQKAAEMFLNLGFKSVTMDDIANEIGISKKTIYAHFDTKTKLVEATTFYLFEIISAGIDEINARQLNGIEELFVIKNFIGKHLKDEKSSPFYQLQKYYPKIFIRLKNMQLEVMRRCVVVNLERGVETGIYRSEINIPFIARIYFMGMIAMKDPNMFPIEEFPIREASRQYLEYHIRAISTDKGLKILHQLLND